MNYFDDCGVMGFICARGSGMNWLREAYTLLGLLLEALWLRNAATPVPGSFAGSLFRPG